MADDIAATTRAATGSHSADQTGSVLSSHSVRDQDSMDCTPDGKSVTSSSHRSARRTDSATPRRSAGLTIALPPPSWASVVVASCLARSQFTGPPDQDSIFCSSAKNGSCPIGLFGSLGSPPWPPGSPKPKPKLLIGSTVVATNRGRAGFRSGPRCAEGERVRAGNVRKMTWAVWLAVPVAVTVLAALWSWARSRPRRLPDTAASMRAHSAYLEALGASTRDRATSPEPSPPGPAPHRPDGDD